MHKVLVRIDKPLYESIQKWCYREKSEGRSMSFQRFFIECITDGIVKRGIK